MFEGLPPQWITAIFGFIGVFVGGGLKYGFDRRLERRTRNAGLLVAIRLTWGDLKDAHNIANDYVRASEDKPLIYVGDFPTASFVEHRATLAQELTKDTWMRLQMVQEWMVMLNRATAPMEPGDEIPADWEHEMRGFSSNISKHVPELLITLSRLADRAEARRSSQDRRRWMAFWMRIWAGRAKRRAQVARRRRARLTQADVGSPGEPDPGP